MVLFKLGSQYSDGDVEFIYLFVVGMVALVVGGIFVMVQLEKRRARKLHRKSS